MSSDNYQTIVIHPTLNADVGDLPLITDTQYAERFTSESLNRRLYGIVRRGIFRGFGCEAGSGLTLNITKGDKESVALVERDSYTLTVRQQHDVSFTVAAGKAQYVVLEAFYEHGTLTKQVDSTSTVDAAKMMLVDVGSEEEHHLVICKVDVPSGTTQLTDSHISYEEREQGGYDLSGHVEAYDPHTQYIHNQNARQTITGNAYEDHYLRVDADTNSTVGFEATTNDGANGAIFEYVPTSDEAQLVMRDNNAEKHIFTAGYNDKAVSFHGAINAESGLIVTGDVQVTDDIFLSDAGRLYLGDGNDSQFYHTGAYAYWLNNTGHTYIRNLDPTFDIMVQATRIDGTLDEVIRVRADADTYAQLNYNGANRLQTTDYGLWATGNIALSEGAPTANNHVTRKDYVDGVVSALNDDIVSTHARSWSTTDSGSSVKWVRVATINSLGTGKRAHIQMSSRQGYGSSLNPDVAHETYEIGLTGGNRLSLDDGHLLIDATVTKAKPASGTVCGQSVLQLAWKPTGENNEAPFEIWAKLNTYTRLACMAYGSVIHEWTTDVHSLDSEPADLRYVGITDVVVSGRDQTINGAKTFNSQIRADGGLKVKDHVSLALGTNTGANLYHTGAHGYFDNRNGVLFIRNQSDDSNVNIQVTRGDGTLDDAFIAVSDPTSSYVKLLHSNDTKLITTATGIHVTGDVSLSDDLFMTDAGRINLGSGNDLQVFHNGTHSYLTTSTGGLYIDNYTEGSATVMRVHDGATSRETIKAVSVDGSTQAQLFYNGNQRLKTAVNGIEVTGNVVGSDAPTSDNHLTRKDYVDGLDAENVKLTGAQTIVGNKVFNDVDIKQGQFGTESSIGAAMSHGWNTGGDTPYWWLAPQKRDGSGADFDKEFGFHWDKYGDGVPSWFVETPLSLIATPTHNRHATPKEYVDTLDQQNVKIIGAQTISGRKTFDGGLKISGSSWNSAQMLVEGTSPNVEFRDTAFGDHYQVGVNDGTFFVLSDNNRDGYYDTPLALTIDADRFEYFGQRIYHDNYHPEADNALQLGGIDATTYARRDEENTFQGTVTTHGTLRVLDETKVTTNHVFETNSTVATYRTDAPYWRLWTGHADAVQNEMIRVDGRAAYVGLWNPISLNDQQDTANALTRKDYVDGLDTDNVKLSGDQTVSGNKIFSNGLLVAANTRIGTVGSTNFPSILFGDSTGGSLVLQGGANTNSGHVVIQPNVNDTSTQFEFRSNTEGTGVLQAGAQWDQPNALTRKDYVDGLDAESVKLTGSQTVAGTKTFTSEIEAQGGIKLFDNDVLYLGDGRDAEMGHDGTNHFINNRTGHMYVTNLAADQNLLLRATRGTGEVDSVVDAIGDTDGTYAQLRHNNNIRLKTRSGGVTVTGNIVSSVEATADDHVTRKDYVDGLDAENVKLDGDQNISGRKTFDGGLTVSGSSWNNAQMLIEGGSPNIEFRDTEGHYYQVGANNSAFYVLNDSTRDGIYESPYIFTLTDASIKYLNYNVYHDGYHPQADNADTLDNLDSSQFLRSDAATTASGVVTFNYAPTIPHDGAASDTFLTMGNTFPEGSNYYINNTGGDNILHFYREGVSDYLVYAHGHLGSSTQGTLWGSANDGAGSGLDADKVDGLQASQFIRSDASDSASGDLTFTGSTRFAGSIGNAQSEVGVYAGVSAGSDPHIQLQGSSNGAQHPHIDFTADLNADFDARLILDDAATLSVESARLNALQGVGTDNHHATVGGGQFETDTSTLTGAINIVLPVSWTSTMLSFWIDVYEYTDGQTFSIFVGGYNYSADSIWHRTSAVIIDPTGNNQHNVRFGHDGSKCVISIGENTTNWSYTQVKVRDFHHGYSDVYPDRWNDGWSINIGALPSNIDSIISPSLYASNAGNALELDGRSSTDYVRRWTLGQSGGGSGWRKVGTFSGAQSHRMQLTLSGRLGYASVPEENTDNDGHVTFDWTWGNTTSAELDAVITGYLTQDALTVTSKAKVIQTDTLTAELWIEHGTFHAMDVQCSANEHTTIIEEGGLNSQAEPTGDVESYVTLNRIYHDAYHPNADKLTTVRTITLDGDVTGSVDFDGSSDVTITADVPRVGHGYEVFTLSTLGLTENDDAFANAANLSEVFDIIGNAMNSKTGGGYVKYLKQDITNESALANWLPVTWAQLTIELNGNYLAATANHRDNFSGGRFTSGGQLNHTTNSSWRRKFDNAYHPNADTLTTSRTITLTDDASGSVSFDGSSDVSMSVTVADNSHKHNQLIGATWQTIDLDDIGNNTAAGTLQFDCYASGSTGGVGQTNNANAVLTAGQHGSGYSGQLSFSSDGRLYHRNNPATTSGTWKKIAYTDDAPAEHNHTTLTGVTSISFATESSDAASISTTVAGTSSYFDFNLSDDLSQADLWRWQFTPSGEDTFTAMQLNPVSTGNADLTVSGGITADYMTVKNGTLLATGLTQTNTLTVVDDAELQGDLAVSGAIRDESGLAIGEVVYYYDVNNYLMTDVASNVIISNLSVGSTTGLTAAKQGQINLTGKYLGGGVVHVAIYYLVQDLNDGVSVPVTPSEGYMAADIDISGLLTKMGFSTINLDSTYERQAATAMLYTSNGYTNSISMYSRPFNDTQVRLYTNQTSGSAVAISRDTTSTISSAYFSAGLTLKVS